MGASVFETLGNDFWLRCIGDQSHEPRVGYRIEGKFSKEKGYRLKENYSNEKIRQGNGSS